MSELVNIPLEDSLASDPFVSTIFALSFTMLAGVLAFGKRKLLQRGMNFFANRQRSTLFSLQPKLGNAMGAMAICVLIAMAALCAMALFGVKPTPSLPTWRAAMAYSSVMAAYLVFKYAAYRFSYWMFFDKAAAARWMGDYATLLVFNSFAFFFIALLAIHFNMSPQALQVTALALLALDKLLIIYKQSAQFIKAKIGLLMFFLQFCTLEIMPCFISYKMLLELNIMFL